MHVTWMWDMSMFLLIFQVWMSHPYIQFERIINNLFSYLLKKHLTLFIIFSRNKGTLKPWENQTQTLFLEVQWLQLKPDFKFLIYQKNRAHLDVHKICITTQVGVTLGIQHIWALKFWCHCNTPLNKLAWRCKP